MSDRVREDVPQSTFESLAQLAWCKWWDLSGGSMFLETSMATGLHAAKNRETTVAKQTAFSRWRKSQWPPCWSAFAASMRELANLLLKPETPSAVTPVS